MGVSRNITLEIYTEIESSYNLIKDVLIGIWFDNEEFDVRTFYKDATDNDDLSDFIKFSDLKTLLDKRDSLRKKNTISVNIEKLNEGLIISSTILKNNFNDVNKFELYFSPGGSHKLANFERNTDFSFYLNIILPQLDKMNCQPTQINCLDFG